MNTDSRNELPPAFQGSFRLFRFAGVDVFIHWSWFLAAYFLISTRHVQYSAQALVVLEYICGFAIVLLHELGHVFACRSVGGVASRVLLWPLGGLAFVTTPPRPAANLWTVMAGPLVNVFLAPILYGLMSATAPATYDPRLPLPDSFRFVQAVFQFNLVMLIFNLLPFFPLDGGQILHSLLWFLVGRGWSLAIAAGIGTLSAGGLLIYAASEQEWWLVMMMGFLALTAFNAIRLAKIMIAIERAGLRDGCACPHCRAAPPIGPFWKCSRCQTWCDVFEHGVCPSCGVQFVECPCLVCNKMGAVVEWSPAIGVPETEWMTSENVAETPRV
jgi:Zn-dependent protease